MNRVAIWHMCSRIDILYSLRPTVSLVNFLINLIKISNVVLRYRNLIKFNVKGRTSHTCGTVVFFFHKIIWHINDFLINSRKSFVKNKCLLKWNTEIKENHGGWIRQRERVLSLEWPGKYASKTVSHYNEAFIWQ